MASNKIFRFDDISVNSDVALVNDIASFLFDRFKGCEVIFGISPIVNSDCGQRVFPSIFNAYSDYQIFYEVNRCGIPEGLHPLAMRAAHGLIHVDHRLLDRGAQEMSILTSCALAGAKRFIPPFNKWNRDTENICNENNITLVKFEDGWLSMEHNIYNPSHEKYYLHSYAWTMEKIINWFA